MDYLPSKEADKVVFYDNLLSKIDAAGATTGLSAAEITLLKTACTKNKTVIKDYNDGATTLQKLKATKETQLKTGNKDVRTIVDLFDN